MKTIEVEYEAPRVIDGAGRTTYGAFVVAGKRFEFPGSPDRAWDEDSENEWHDQIKAAHDAAFDYAATLTLEVTQ